MFTYMQIAPVFFTRDYAANADWYSRQGVSFPENESWSCTGLVHLRENGGGPCMAPREWVPW